MPARHSFVSFRAVCLILKAKFPVRPRKGRPIGVAASRGLCPEACDNYVALDPNPPDAVQNRRPTQDRYAVAMRQHAVQSASATRRFFTCVRAIEASLLRGCPEVPHISERVWGSMLPITADHP